MKRILTFSLLLTSIFAYGQNLTFEDWQEMSIENKRLLPKNGDLNEGKKEQKSNEEFIRETMKSFESRIEASNHMVDLGFTYLYRGNLETAMYRFNQAFLLDSNNSNIFWGYGAIYMAFGKYDLSRKQYDEGLKINNKNDNILIDYGTTYLGEYYDYYETDKSIANQRLDKAIQKLEEAYKVNTSNPNSSYKLSICYLNKDNCKQAKEYLKISENLGNSNITEAYKTELSQKCSSIDLDCSLVKTGKFKIVDKQSGETIIERTENFQIEENKKYGYKLKLEVTWLNGCTYKLKPVMDLLNPKNKELPKMILTSTIVEITEDGYIQVSNSDVNPSQVKAKVTKIK